MRDLRRDPLQLRLPELSAGADRVSVRRRLQLRRDVQLHQLSARDRPRLGGPVMHAVRHSDGAQSHRHRRQAGVRHNLRGAHHHAQRKNFLPGKVSLERLPRCVEYPPVADRTTQLQVLAVRSVDHVRELFMRLDDGDQIRPPSSRPTRLFPQRPPHR